MKLQIPDEIIIFSYLFDTSLPLINDTYPHLVLSEPEAKLNDPLLPPADGPIDIVASFLLLTSYSLLNIMSAPSLLNDNKPNVKLNNYQSLPNDTSVFIIIDPPVPFSPDST